MRNKKGAALIEFTVIFPLLIIVLFGIIEFGFIIYNKAMITNASREGARYGIVMANPRITADQIRTVVKNYCSNHLITFTGGTTLVDNLLPDGNIDVVGAEGAFPADLTVTVTYNYGFLVIPRFVESLGFGPITLTAETVMRME